MSATTQTDAQFAAARHVLDDAVRDGAFPGAAYGVLADGQLAIGSVGSFTFNANSPVVLPGTSFDIASVTKVVATAAMAMLLTDRGRLPLDLAVGDILPEFVAGEPQLSHKRDVTVRMLLAHSSGLPGWAPLYQTCAGAQSLLSACYAMPLAYPPLTVAEYSDLGFILLGELLQRIAGEPLGSFCTREVFDPLAMARTQFTPPPYLRPDIPPSEDDRAFRHRIIQGEVQDENCWVMGGVSGHAGLFSTTEDLLRFAACLLGQTVPLFSSETVTLFTSRQTVPPNTSRALGWDTPSAENSSSGHLFSPHSAGHLGFSGASLWIDFDQRTAVALLSNRCWPSRDNHAIRTVRPAFHDAVMPALRGLRL